MGFWSRIIGNKQEETPVSQQRETTAIATAISPLVDGIAHAVFMDYRDVLLKEPIDYVVPAVWGASNSGALTPQQKEINSLVLPVIKKIFAHLELVNLNEAQRFAIDFLIRGLIINRVTYTIEAAKGRGLDQAPGPVDLEDMDTVGNA